MTDTPREQIADAYRQMAHEANYRPMVPTDATGNVYMPEEELDLDAEIHEYQEQWECEEGNLEFVIGACDYPTRTASIFVIEAARCLSGTQTEIAHRLLQMAIRELEHRNPEDPLLRVD